MSFGRRFCPIRRGRDILKTNRLSKTVCVNSRVTKAQVILLPHLRDRPVTLKRYPNGALGEFFYGVFGLVSNSACLLSCGRRMSSFKAAGFRPPTCLP